MVVCLSQLGRHTDAIAVFSNTLAVIWLAVSVISLAFREQRGLTRGVAAGWILLGSLRAASALWGYAPGWSIDETINVRDRTTSSHALVRDLDFKAGNVPAHLINDGYELNFRGDRDDDPSRSTLPLALTAETFVAGEGVLRITSSSPIRVTVGPDTLELKPPIVDYERRLSLPGEEIVRIAFAATPADGAALSVYPEGVQLFSSPTTGPGMSVRRWLGDISRFLDLVVVVGTLLMIVHLARRRLTVLRGERAVRTGLVSLALILSLAPHLATWYSQHDSLIVLSGGDDWLTYETFARDIRDNSLLMLGGHAVGQATPFYYQPLYPYVVAAGHFFLGDSVQAIVLMQIVSVGVVLLLVVASASDGIISTAVLLLILMGTGTLDEWMLLAQRLLSENLLILLFGLLLFAISRVGRIPRPGTLAIIGLLLGSAGVARSTAWMAVPFLLVLLLRGTPRPELRIRMAAVLIPLVVVAALVPVRNAIASGSLVLLPTSGSVNLFLGNVPKGRKLTTEPWMELSKSYDPRLVAVAEATVDAPDQVAQMVRDKATYVLGFPRSMDADNPAIFWPVLSLWMLAPLGAFTRSHSRVEWSCLILALTHVLSLIIIFPNNYYYRLELPITLPLAIWDAAAVTQLILGFPNPSRLGRWGLEAVGDFRTKYAGW